MQNRPFMNGQPPMNEALEKMDELADKAIANWSLGALMVNMLPPPLAQRALGKVAFEISEDLSRIYEVERDTALFKNVAGAMANDLRDAYQSEPEATHSGLDHLKYIPGINIWVGMMMQPHTATAVTRSIGRAFKEFFHAQLRNDNIQPHEVARMAANSFRETLTHLEEVEQNWIANKTHS